MIEQRHVDFSGGIWRDLVVLNAIALFLVLIDDTGNGAPANDEETSGEPLALTGPDMPSGGWFG